MSRLKFLLLSLALAVFSAAAPSNEPHHAFPDPDGNYTSVPDTLWKRADKVPLRILALGASITWGLGSSTGNGYRKPLRDQLRVRGWTVDMVGSKTNGDMFDNEVEAHSGDTIAQVSAASQRSRGYRPNVVLINAGTNDCAREIDIPGAGDRMRSLITSFLNSDGMDKTTIVLSTLLPSGEDNIALHRVSVNNQYRALVKAMAAEGVSIVLADMDPDTPDPAHGWLDMSTEYHDKTHPNDEGYKKMAYIWYDAILQASEKGFLKVPNAMVDNDGTCDKAYGDGVYAGGLTQRGSGEEDGIYYHDSESMGIVHSVLSDFDRNQWFFARLFRQDRDDLLGWFERDDGAVAYGTWRNTGNPSEMFVKIADTSVADNCIQPGVNFIDINADGLDDFVCIGKDGTAYASINNGDGTDSVPPTFKYIGKIKDSEGYPQGRVLLADIDGDGRADYCVLADNGGITCWRNGWINDAPKYWQPLGQRFTGKGFNDLNGVRFEDINGDGRDDWLWLDDAGQTFTWTNSRSCHTGEEGDGLKVIWRQGFAKNQGAGPTHFGMSGFGDTGLRARVHFARIFGVPQDFGLLGRQDYVFMEHVEESSGRHRFNMRVWKNTGGGATKIRADGNAYCNMLGHPNGMMDYVWILSKGDMRIYTNKGMTTVDNSDGSSFWGPNYVIFDPASQAIGRDLDRRDLHLVDWDGDGACDIVWTDPDNQNRPQLWRNRIKETGNFNWEWHSNPAPALYCPEKRGLGFFDRPVHFADVSGNRKGDYLCVEKDGRTWGFVHQDTDSWEYIDQFKFSEDRDRANIHWADVDGDGRADMIHTNKFNGDGTVWLNKGRKDIGGSRYEWEPKGALYEGAVAGACTYFPDLDGDGRADMHSITNALANTAETWFNMCDAPNKIGDGGQITDPNLPTRPGDGDDSGGGDDGGDDNGGGDNEDKCTSLDDTWSNAATRQGDYYEYVWNDPKMAGVPYGRQYITIVNLTPYTFKYLADKSHYYQMDEWTFGNIPPGRSMQCVMDYYDGKDLYSPVDDAGEAYFEVSGTSHTFAIKARTHYGSAWTKRTIIDLSGWGHGVREFEDPGPGVPVTLVITGSNDYGIYTSLGFEASGPTGWMGQISDVIRDRKLKHVVMPGSHDAGMDRISGTVLGDNVNTQTQGLSIYQQLVAGSRYFDLRIVSDSDGKYVAAHLNDEMAPVFVGGLGAPLPDMIDDINRFYDEVSGKGGNNGEVVILWLRYLVDIDKVAPVDRYWDWDTLKDFYTKLEGIDNRCPDIPVDDTNLNERNMSYFMEKNNGKGCVLIINDGNLNAADPDLVRIQVDKGIYGPGNIPREDKWTQNGDPKTVAEAQVAAYKGIRADGSSGDKLHISQWLTTNGLIELNEYSIQLLSIFAMNPTLYWKGVMGMSPTGFPSVLLTNYVGVRLQHQFDDMSSWGAEIKVLAMGLNLYLVSHNCKISTIRNPIRKGSSLSRLFSAPTTGSNWDGIIFANGTVLDDRPSDLELWKQTVWKSGTVFANGTVLTHDVEVPDSWWSS